MKEADSVVENVQKKAVIARADKSARERDKNGEIASFGVVKIQLRNVYPEPILVFEVVDLTIKIVAAEVDESGTNFFYCLRCLFSHSTCTCLASFYF